MIIAYQHQHTYKNGNKAKKATPRICWDVRKFGTNDEIERNSAATHIHVYRHWVCVCVNIKKDNCKANNNNYHYYKINYVYYNKTNKRSNCLHVRIREWLDLISTYYMMQNGISFGTLKALTSCLQINIHKFGK